MDGIRRRRGVLLTPALAPRPADRRAGGTTRAAILAGLLALLALGLGACHAGLSAPVGISVPRSPERQVAAPSAALTETPPVPDDFRLHMTRVAGPFLSRGHGERFDAIVWANETARPIMEGQGDGADGALLIEEAIVHDVRGDEAAGLLVMQRRDGWRFAAIDPDGTVVSDQRVAGCASCHGEAPHSVFPLGH